MESLSIKIPEYCNPAEFYMDILTDQAKGAAEWKNLNTYNYQLHLHPTVLNEIGLEEIVNFNKARKIYHFKYFS